MRMGVVKEPQGMATTNGANIMILLLLCAGSMVSAHWPGQRKIEHVVVVMMENRAFDHVLGFLKALDPRIQGLDGTESNPVNVSNPGGPSITVSHAALDHDPDCGHSVEATCEQAWGAYPAPDPLPSVAPMNGFVQNAIKEGGATWGPAVMACFNHTTVPVISTLAQEFAIFDEYHASVPGPTEVNRLYLQSASSHGDAINNEAHLALGYPQKSIYQLLSENGLSWGSYFQEAPTSLFFDWTRRPENLKNFHNFPVFEEHARAGSLPNYSFVDPKYFDIKLDPATDQHPSHSMAEGERFLKEVYETLRLSPLWEKTLLIITYDEHGGFYDHFPTPANIPNPDGLVSTSPPFDFTRAGIRVPFILVSPWIEKGTVVHGPTSGPFPDSLYEHTSIIATVSKLFNLQGGPLNMRYAWAATFEHVLSRTTPRLDCPLVLPSPPMSAVSSQDEVSQLQEGFVNLARVLLEVHTGISAPALPEMDEETAGCFVSNSIATFLGKKPSLSCA